MGYRDFGKEDYKTFYKIEKILNTKYFKNKRIYIFTNNMNKLLQNCKSLRKKNYLYINFNYHKESVHALDLMKNFRHFVIGSSTFHWWGAFLAKNPKKIVLTDKIHAPLVTKEMKKISF